MLASSAPDLRVPRMNATALAAAADGIEAAAFRDMIAAAPQEFARAVGLKSATAGGATLLIAPGIPDNQFNRAIGLGMHSAATEAAVDSIAAEFAAAGCSNYWIHWNPLGSPENAPQWLAARGFVLAPRRSWAKLARGVDSLPRFSSALEVRGANPGEENAAGEAIAGAFGMPPVFAGWFAALALRPRWRMYVALDAARVVGGGLLYVQERDAWLGAGGVLKEFRGRGAHLELMALRIREARAVGCTRVFTETGEPIGNEANPSLANMHRCRFQHLCSRLNYAAPDSRGSSAPR
jgi:GNAT superfamily N-acetyltransferase